MLCCLCKDTMLNNLFVGIPISWIHLFIFQLQSSRRFVSMCSDQAVTTMGCWLCGGCWRDINGGESRHEMPGPGPGLCILRSTVSCPDTDTGQSERDTDTGTRATLSRFVTNVTRPLIKELFGLILLDSDPN